VNNRYQNALAKIPPPGCDLESHKTLLSVANYGVMAGDQCLLCGAEAAVIGVFVPKDAEKWGGCKDKARLFRYCLCAKCNDKLDKAEKVEKVIRAELAGGGSQC